MAGPARAQDLSAKLAEAETAEGSAAGAVEGAEAQRSRARSSYAKSAQRAAPAKRAARGARAEVRELETRLADQRQHAAGHVSKLEATHEQEVDDHDQQVSAGIGFALAALVVSVIALGWNRFRTSSAVRWLSELGRGQAIGLCVSGGLALLIGGTAMAGGGIAIAALGGFIALLGIVLPICLLMARHSLRVQRGRDEPIGKGEPPPTWVRTAIAVAMAIMFLTGLGAALSADAPEAELVSAELRERAVGKMSGALTDRLVRTEAKAKGLGARASRLGAAQAKAGKELAGSRRQLRRAKRRLARAEGETRHYARRLVQQGERERREEEERAEEEAEEVEKVEEEEAASCDPNYTGCLDPNSPDYDCAGGSGNGPDYTGPVQVIGEDHYGLDADGDGYACE